MNPRFKIIHEVIDSKPKYGVYELVDSIWLPIKYYLRFAIVDSIDEGIVLIEHLQKEDVTSYPEDPISFDDLYESFFPNMESSLQGYDYSYTYHNTQPRGDNYARN